MTPKRPGTDVAPSPRRGWGPVKRMVTWAVPTLALLGVLAVGAAAGAASTTVTEKNNPSFGTILADSAAKTLYTLTSNGSPVLCTGACAQIWPPLTVPPGSQVTGPPGVCCLGSTTNANGDAVTYKGDPLYRYINDSSSSDATGDGVMSFGGTWHVVRVAAAPATTTTTAPPAAAPASTTTTAATAAPTATSTPAASAAAAPVGPPGTGGTPSRGSDVALLVGIGALALGFGCGAAALRRSRGEA